MIPPQVTEATEQPPTASAAVSAGRGWDLLLLSLAGFILTSVARVHQLFPALEVIRPVAVTGVLAIGLSLVDRVSARRISAFRIPATRYLLALVGWMALSVPGALWPGGKLRKAAATAVMRPTIFHVEAAGAFRPL